MRLSCAHGRGEGDLERGLEGVETFKKKMFNFPTLLGQKINHYQVKSTHYGNLLPFQVVMLNLAANA